MPESQKRAVAKLNGVSTLPAEARRFLLRYNNFLTSMGEMEATEATIDGRILPYSAKVELAGFQLGGAADGDT